MDLKTAIQSNNYTVIDVRTYQEFMGGHVSGAINIPLQELPEKIETIKQYDKPIILCCASGGRSGQAQHYLQQLGIASINGGSWLDVNYLISNQS
jgi:phage shock protein E